ncbi:hypothetical protein YC2023_060811 [Brassica napus]
MGKGHESFGIGNWTLDKTSVAFSLLLSLYIRNPLLTELSANIVIEDLIKHSVSKSARQSKHNLLPNRDDRYLEVTCSLKPNTAKLPRFESRPLGN